jgi:hypothetical protein
MPMASALAFQSMMTSLRAGTVNSAAAIQPVIIAMEVLDAGFIDEFLRDLPWQLRGLLLWLTDPKRDVVKDQ